MLFRALLLLATLGVPALLAFPQAPTSDDLNTSTGLVTFATSSSDLPADLPASTDLPASSTGTASDLSESDLVSSTGVVSVPAAATTRLPTLTTAASVVSTSLITSAAASATPAANHSISHLVTVGGGSLTYQPSSINASVGDTIIFTFKAPNHTVTQSSFATPCTYLVDSTGAPLGLDSGFVPVASNATNFPEWSLLVTTTDPLWFYCRQPTHCEQGMVFGVNVPATGTNTYAAFLANAKAVKASAVSFTETASAKWTGSGLAAASSTGVFFPSTAGQATKPSSTTTTTKKSGSAKVVGQGVAGVTFALLATVVVLS